jgi:hypothetical protein
MRLNGTPTHALTIIFVGLFVLGTVTAGSLGIVDARTDVGHPQEDNAVARAAAEPTPIASCTTITEPGEYVLSNDIGPTSGEEPCLLINTNDVTLDGNGFAIDGVVAVGEFFGGTFFRGHTFRDVTAHSLRGELLADVTVVSSDLADGVRAVYFNNLTVTDSRLGGPVAAIDDTVGVVVTNSTFDGEQGVLLWASAYGSLIENNTFETNDTAIFIGTTDDYTRNVRITNNRFDMRGGTAISTIEESPAIVVRDNVITNATVGLDFRAGGVIDNNTLSENDVGIIVFYTAVSEGGLLIANNRITDNRVGVFVDADSANPQIIRLRGNIINGNSEFGVRNSFRTNEYDEDYEMLLLDARNNYWGAANGPSSAPADDSDAPFADPVTGRLADGAGDAVSEGNTPGISNVRFDPFLTSPPNETDDEAQYYQVDFVVGDVIHTFGPANSDQFYSDQARLIRFLHGSSATPIERVGTPPTLSSNISSCIAVESFEVAGDIATVRYTVASGCSLDVALVSYEKPGPDWSRVTASDQRLVDAATAHAADPGTYELTVSLPTTTTVTETDEALTASHLP